VWSGLVASSCCLHGAAAAASERCMIKGVRAAAWIERNRECDENTNPNWLRQFWTDGGGTGREKEREREREGRIVML
jgi:hypothetical protein